MAEEYEVRLTADNEISDEARDAAKALDEIPESVKTDLEMSGVDKALAELDKLNQDAHATAVAAEELGRALGPELAARADLTGVVEELTRVGASIEDVTVNADQFAAKLREADSANIGGKLGQSLGTARGETEKLRDSARGANSALANMVGNSAQDLGALTGVVGSLGVGLGQMGEYAADAAFGGEKLSSALGSMAKVAGPIAALGVAIQGVGTYLEGIKAEDAFREELADDFASALREVNDAAKAVNDTMVEIVETTGQLEFSEAGGGFLGLGRSAGDLLPVLDRLDIKFKQFIELAAGGGEDVEAALSGARDELNAMATGRTPWDSQRVADLNDYIAGLEQYAGSAEAAAERDRLRAEALESLADATAPSQEQITKFAQALAEIGAESDALDMDDVRSQVEAVGDALNEAAVKTANAESALRDLGSTFSQIGVQQDALSSLFDLGNAPLDAAGEVRDIAAAIGELSEAADGISGEDIRLGTIDADPLLDSIDSLRPEIQAKVTEAFSAGGPEAATAMASSYIDQVTAELDGKLSREDVARLLGLEDIEAKVAVALELSDVENARRQLEILTGIGGETPYTASIGLALDAGTISGEEAQALIQEKLVDAGVTIPGELAVDTTAATEVVDGFVSAQRATTPVDLEADPSAAEDVADDFVDERRTTTPVELDLTSAKAAALILAFLTLPRTATIDVKANPLAAALTIANLLQRRTAYVDIAAGAINLPTAGQLAQRIGTIRVPIDTYVRHSARIDGGG